MSEGHICSRSLVLAPYCGRLQLKIFWYSRGNGTSTIKTQRNLKKYIAFKLLEKNGVLYIYTGGYTQGAGTISPC